MIITKAGKFNMIRFLGIFCAIAMGFLTLVATSEDDVKDAVDIDFSETADIELNDVTVERIAVASIYGAGDDCDDISVAQALIDLEEQIEDLDEVDIEEIDLEYVEGTYSGATWLPAEITAITCSLTITGVTAEQSTTIAETVIQRAGGASGALSTDDLTDDQRDVLNFYLENRDEEFEYCVECSDTDLDSYSVTYSVNIGIEISGEI